MADSSAREEMALCTIDHAVRIVRLAPVIARLSMTDREARRIVSIVVV